MKYETAWGVMQEPGFNDGGVFRIRGVFLSVLSGWKTSERGI